MKAYLLDTNHVEYLFQEHERVMARLGSLPPDTQIRASVISLGEIEAGHRITETTDQQRRDDFDRFVAQEFRPLALSVNSTTRNYYADLVGGIWQRNPPSSRRTRTERHLVELGVDINDVWIAAQAIEHNLILVTEDNMQCIREAAGKLLDVENWVAYATRL